MLKFIIALVVLCLCFFMVLLDLFFPKYLARAFWWIVLQHILFETAGRIGTKWRGETISAYRMAGRVITGRRSGWRSSAYVIPDGYLWARMKGGRVIYYPPPLWTRANVQIRIAAVYVGIGACPELLRGDLAFARELAEWSVWQHGDEWEGLEPHKILQDKELKKRTARAVQRLLKEARDPAGRIVSEDQEKIRLVADALIIKGFLSVQEVDQLLGDFNTESS